MGLREAWESEARSWIRFATTPGHDEGFWRFGLPRLLELLPAPGKRTVDVGCGEGRLPRILRERGHRVVGVDGSPTLVGRAVEAGGGPYVAADAARLPLGDGCADLVVAYMSLHDFDDLGSAIGEVGRVLESGGRFCFGMLHPINSAGAFADRTGDAPFVIEGSYLDARRWEYRTDRAGIPMTFHSLHRPLADYIAPMAAAGLMVETLLEPSIDDAFVAEDPAEARWRRVPLYLFARAVKGR
jgi:SAM-dependent methyltransferase